MSSSTLFSYNLPENLCTITTIMPDGNIKFEPPVYIQRYFATTHILEDPQWQLPLKKIVDFGCAELQLLPILKRVPNVEHIMEVDIDFLLLMVHQQRAVPLIAEHIGRRETPLRVEVLAGSVADAVEQLYDVDVVIALELIEHLQPEVLEKVPDNIFGFVQPKLAIFSTPNSEFNVLFGKMRENGFRHLDHKFEWTRKEFQTWAQNICEKYPNYKVAFIGVGDPPVERKEIGHSTQMAIFAREDTRGFPLKHEIVKQPPTEGAEYKTIYAVDYPVNKDMRSKEQKIVDEAMYFITQNRYNPLFYNEERCIYQMPWIRVMDYADNVSCSESELLEILKSNQFVIEGEFILLPPYDKDEYSSDELDYESDINSDANLSNCNLKEEEVDELVDNLGALCSVNCSSSEENWDD